MPTPPWRRNSIWRREGANNSVRSFRGDTKHRTTMCNCTSENLEIPGLVLTHHPGMTGISLLHSHLPGFPADHRLLAGDAPVVAGQRAALAERAMAGHHEGDRILADRGTDGAR